MLRQDGNNSSTSAGCVLTCSQGLSSRKKNLSVLITRGA